MLLLTFLALPPPTPVDPDSNSPVTSTNAGPAHTINCSALLVQRCLDALNASMADGDLNSNGTADSGEPSRSPMTRVCFSFALLLLGAHNVLVTATPDLRALYGPYLLLALYSHVAVHLTLLISCVVEPESLECTALGVLTHYVVLSAACWLLLTSFHLWYDIYLVGRGLWVIEVYDARQYAKNTAFALLVPALPVGIGLLVHLVIPKHHLDPEYGLSSCGLTSHLGFVGLLFLPLYFAYIAQTLLLLSTLKMHHSNIHERQSLARSKHHQARFSMAVKMVASNWIVWTSAFLSTYLSKSILWHLFTLFCALQVIFLTITFVFTRPVLEVFLKIVDSTKKGEDTMNNGSATLPMLPTLGTRTTLVEAAQVT